MNPLTQKEAVSLAKKVEEGARRFKNIEVVIAPPFPFLATVAEVLRKAKLGAQDASWMERGAYTGEVSWAQLKKLGVQYTIIGHSERRMYMNETNEVINKKIIALLEHGMGAILCVGEREREENEIPALVGEEIRKALHGIKKASLKNLVIAYEPIWAISTSPGARPDTPDSAFRAMVYIRRVLTELFTRTLADSVRIIYGGSVNKENARGFLSAGNMQGALVGGASLDAEHFLKILETI